MQFKSNSTLPQPQPSKDSHSSDSLGYLSWLEDKHNHQQSIEQTSENYLHIASTAKKIPSNKDYCLDNRKSLMSQKQISHKYLQQSAQKKKEYQRTEDKKVIWDDKNSNAIASAMRCLRAKVQDLKDKLSIAEEVNKKLRKQNQDMGRKISQKNYSIVNQKYQSPKRIISLNLDEDISPIKSNHYQQKIKEYQIQLQHKNTIILQLTALIQQQKVPIFQPNKPDQMMYIQKINILELQLQKYRNKSLNIESNKCDCGKLTFKYGKLLQRLSNQQNRSQSYLKQSKQTQKTLDNYKNILKELQTVVNKLPQTTKNQLKKIISKAEQIEKSKFKDLKSLNPNKSSRTLCKSKTKESRDLSSSRNNTFRKLDTKITQQKKSVTSTPRRSKQKKMSSTDIPKLKQSKSGNISSIAETANKDKKKALKQQISILESKIAQIKSQYKVLAAKIHEDPEDYQTIRQELNTIALLLQQKTQELFDRRLLLNDQ